MRESRSKLGWVAAVLVAASCGGRTLTPTPGDDDDAGSAVGGTGGAGSTTGVGGSGGAQGGSAPSSSAMASTGSGFDPIACFTCIGANCPEVLQCIQDMACRDGLVCSISQCLSNGQPDLVCVADCFNGDFQQAFLAFQAITCMLSQCGDVCGDLSMLPFP